MTKHLAPLLLITLFIFSPNSWAEDHSKGNPHPIAEEGPKKNVERCEAWAIGTFQDPKGGPKVYCESGRGKELKGGKNTEAMLKNSATAAIHHVIQPEGLNISSFQYKIGSFDRNIPADRPFPGQNLRLCNCYHSPSPHLCYIRYHYKNNFGLPLFCCSRKRIYHKPTWSQNLRRRCI